MNRRAKGKGQGAKRWPVIWLAFVLFHFALLPQAQAQPRLVELINADSVVAEVVGEETVRRLIGNVVLRQDTTMLRASRAVQYVERGEVVLEGSVRIVSGNDTLTARRVTYDANEKVALATGDVRIADGESVLLAPSARYFSRTKRATFDAGGRLLHDTAELTAPAGQYDTDRKLATFEGPVTLRDSAAVLTSRGGTYDAELERADFAGEVRLRQRGVRLDADSLTHFRSTEISQARGQVVLERLGDARDDADGGQAPDSTRRTLLFGASAVHDERAATSRVEGTPERDPLLVQLRTDSTGATDTTLVRARRFEALQRDSLGGTFSQIAGVGRVRLVQPRLAAVADSAVFSRLEPADSTASTDDRLALYGPARPSVWFEEAQLTGDTLVAVARDEALDHLEVFGEPFAAQLDTTLGRVRQLRGRRMRARFENDSLRTLSVWPNAEAIHFRATPDGLLDGADRLSADSLAFRFADGALREIRGVRGIEGVSYGPAILPEPFQLPGYVYTPERRPHRTTVFTPDGWEARWLDAHSTPEPPEELPDEEAASG